MARVTVLRRFTDLVERCSRVEGDVFEVSEKRAAQLEKRLPDGYVSIEHVATSAAEPEHSEPAAEQVSPDYASMTKAELVAACEEHGIAIPKRATKARLVELLSEE